MLIAGAMDAAAFCAWVEQMLAPTLSPGDLVTCDTFSVHKTAKARAATQARGAELRFRRAHAPDLNPLDMVFAKLKARVRSAAARCADKPVAARCTGP
jgi:transposase